MSLFKLQWQNNINSNIKYRSYHPFFIPAFHKGLLPKSILSNVPTLPEIPGKKDPPGFGVSPISAGIAKQRPQH